MKMKAEGERSEKNLVKTKKKKQKKEPASGPENDTVDDESPTEVKKEKKKNRKGVTVAIEDEASDVGDEKEKRKNVNDDLKDARGSESMETAKEGVKKKKKKKQQQVDDMNPVEIAKISVKEEVKKKEKKEKKVKKNTVQSKAENVKLQKEEEEQQAGKDEEPKTAKKRKHNILSVNTEVTEELIKEKKKKKKKTSVEETTVAVDELTTTKKTVEVGENGLNLETAAGGTEGEEVTVKKKKKNKAKTKEDENGVETPEIKRSKAKKTETDSMLDESGIFIEEEKTEPKKKGKGRKASVEVTEVEDTAPKIKKRKRGSSKGEEEPSLIKCEEVEEADDTTSKKIKMKKSSAEVTQAEKDVGVETGAKKKKKKKIKEEESSQVDVVFVSEKSGNTDEISITQEGRRTLQMEIDKASQPERLAKPLGLGQWSTAQFKSSDQQQKFLRLMGGFKKGFQPAAARTDGANMAMGKEAQQQLQQGLLGEFERAHSRRMDFSNRGTGLGFTAPSNKKFSIDVNASRSTRFDD